MRKSFFMALISLIMAVPAFAVNSKPVRELIVSNAAIGDGEYSSISAALADVNGTTPVVIKVMPGTYSDKFTMKSNVHLEGDGRDVTMIIGYINMSSVQNVTISGFTIQYTNYVWPEQGVAIYIDSSSPTIANCKVMASTGLSGIEVASASPIIEGNIFDFSIGGYKAINIDADSAPIIRNNKILNTQDMAISGQGSPIITNNTIEGGYGLELGLMNATVTSNIIKNTGWYGIEGGGPNSVIKDNIVIGNTPGDLCISNGVNVTFNVYDTHCINSNPTCNLNVKPDGTLHNQCN